MTARAVFALVLFAFALVAGTAAPALAQQALQVVGVVERMRGEAERINTDGTAALNPGSEIRVDDVVRTGRDARLVIRFVDTSMLVLGQNAHIIVDEMVYAPNAAPGAGTQVIDVLRGMFRYISGAIGGATPDRVVIRTPVATIGIRGTNFAGGELFTGMPPGRPHYGFQITEGAIDVITPGGTATLDEPGEGTFLPLTRVAPPTAVRVWGAAAQGELEAGLAF